MYKNGLFKKEFQNKFYKIGQLVLQLVFSFSLELTFITKFGRIFYQKLLFLEKKYYFYECEHFHGNINKLKCMAMI